MDNGKQGVKGSSRGAVLVADDEPTLRRLVKATIMSDDYTVLEAVDGEQAWKILCEQRPAVALLDVAMPGLTGLELTRAIRADPDLKNTTVILLTAKTQAHDIEEGIAAGADLYLTKPFSPMELLVVIEEAFNLP